MWKRASGTAEGKRETCSFKRAKMSPLLIHLSNCSPINSVCTSGSVGEMMASGFSHLKSLVSAPVLLLLMFSVEGTEEWPYRPWLTPAGLLRCPHWLIWMTGPQHQTPSVEKSPISSQELWRSLRQREQKTLDCQTPSRGVREDSCFRG